MQRVAAKREKYNLARRRKRRAVRSGASSKRSPRDRQRTRRGATALENYARIAGITVKGKLSSEIRIQYPEVFSFIENPDATLAVVERLVRAIRSPLVKKIFLDQSACSHVDYGAEALIGAIANLAREERRSSTLHLSGSVPKSPQAAAIVLATGVPKILGVQGLPDQPEFRCFELVRGERGNEKPGRSSVREATQTGLVRYIGDCLADYHYTLKPDGRRFLSRIIGEVIGNAEDHGGGSGWWAGAYLRQPTGQSFGDVHLTIFNLGRTMAETLQDLGHDSLLRKSIEGLVKRHRGFWHSNWKVDMLWTVYALQEGVSRKNDHPTRVGNQGRGTADLIEYFQFLGKARDEQKPRMALVSGRTHILFDEDRFPLIRVRTEQGEMRRVALNESNSLDEPPSREVVRRLHRHFPGTLLSLRFYLDPEHLQAVHRREEEWRA